LDLSEENLIVIGVGRLEEQKRFDVSLRAIRLVVDRIPTVRFLLVGDGTKRDELESLAAELDLLPFIRLTGARPDVPSLLGISDGFLLTSDFEGLPVALLEALVMQVPAVATDVDGTSEVLGAGGGILVPPRDPSAVASAITDLLTDVERRRIMGRQGRELVKRRYSARIVRKQIDEVYRTVLQRATQPTQRHAEEPL